MSYPEHLTPLSTWLLVSLLLTACGQEPSPRNNPLGTSNPEDPIHQAQDDVLEMKRDIPLPDTQIAVVPRRRSELAQVIVNHSHSRYLIDPKKSDRGPGGHKVYRHPFFRFYRNSNPKPITNYEMKAFLDHLTASGYFSRARSITLKEMKDPNWPPNDALLVEQGTSMKVLYSPKRISKGASPLTPQEARVLRLFIQMKIYINRIGNRYIFPEVISGSTPEEIFRTPSSSRHLPSSGNR